MRATVVLLGLVISVAAMGSEISDEFKSGFAGVPWGMDLAELMTKLPGGLEYFTTAPGGICYFLSTDDPVLGIVRAGQFVGFFTGKDGKVELISIQIPYDQTSALISTLTSQLGAPQSLEIEGITTTRTWPVDHGLVASIRTTNDRKYGLTTLGLGKAPTASPAATRRRPS